MNTNDQGLIFHNRTAALSCVYWDQTGPQDYMGKCPACEQERLRRLKRRYRREDIWFATRYFGAFFTAFIVGYCLWEWLF
jgi:hypothetical protein